MFNGGRQELKEVFQVVRNSNKELQNQKTINKMSDDQLLITCYNALNDIYDDFYNKDHASELVKCFQYNYGFLYK